MMLTAASCDGSDECFNATATATATAAAAGTAAECGAGGGRGDGSGSGGGGGCADGGGGARGGRKTTWLAARGGKSMRRMERSGRGRGGLGEQEEEEKNGGREGRLEYSEEILASTSLGRYNVAQAGSRVEEFPSRSEMLALLLSTVPGGVVTLRPTLPWGSTRNAAGPPLPDGTIPHIDLNSAVWRADKLSDA
ncbi:PREDICTED: spidroin-1-like [Atta colombica]|uniref:spidroin-1-like n=1 Tax=Atta colombica TaxID=520822 RepID=UPI00084BFF23|nr:PREDICTED: spidroin-1-like [Atta colombica]